MFELLACPIVVPPEHMSAIVRTESQANPFAVGVVGHNLSRQPTSQNEAKKLVAQLAKDKMNYSVGVAQVNQVNFSNYGLNINNMFELCTNLNVGSRILKSCYERYKNWEKAYSCYYAGNDQTGFHHGYVNNVLKNMTLPILKNLNLPTTQRSNDTPIRLIPHQNQKEGGQFIQETKPTLRQRRLSSPLSVLTD